MPLTAILQSFLGPCVSSPHRAVDLESFNRGYSILAFRYYLCGVHSVCDCLLQSLLAVQLFCPA